MDKKLTRRKMLQLTGGTVALSSVFPSLAFAKSQSSGVASDPEPKRIGDQILREGGNAIDAVVGAALAAGVYIPSKCGLGGYGGAMVIGLANGKITCIDFNMKAPAAAHADMFPIDQHLNVINKINAHGWLAAGVPGTAAGLEMAAKRYGTWSLPQLFQPAIKLAKSWKKQDRFVKFPNLAKTFTTLADRGSMESLYHGDIAEEIASAFKKGGGLVTTKDLADYQAREVVPYSTEWQGSTIYAAPLGANGLMVLQAIAILKAMKWEAFPVSPSATHARLDAMRLVWKDRFELYGDPDFVDVPIKHFLSEDYAAAHAARVEQSVKDRKPIHLEIERVEQVGTLHISAADDKGNFASVTLTQGNGYGAQVCVDSLGLVLGNGMARFDPRPGKPNSIAPGKRPVHNMSPMLMSCGGKPCLAIGAAGGTKIPNALYDFFCGYLGRREMFEAAVDAPRMNCFGTLDVYLESGFKKEDASYLEKIGFKLTNKLGAYLSAVERDPTTGNAKDRSHIGNPFQEKTPEPLKH